MEVTVPIREGADGNAVLAELQDGFASRRGGGGASRSSSTQVLHQEGCTGVHSHMCMCADRCVCLFVCFCVPFCVTVQCISSLLLSCHKAMAKYLYILCPCSCVLAAGNKKHSGG